MAFVTYSPPTLRERVTSAVESARDGAKAAIRELIGGPQRLVRRWTEVVWGLTSTRDVGVTDYAFYDKLRRGKARGLELSGLLVKPLTSKITAWAIGRPPTIKYDKSAKMAERMNEWWQKNHATIMQTYNDSLDLADMYLVVNGDLTLTAINPHVVKPIVDERDYSSIIGWRIDEVYPHPTEPGKQMHIRDEYTAGRRVRTTWINGGQPVVTTYRLPIKNIPVIKCSNKKSADEMFGHAEPEAMIPLLQEYGEVLAAGKQGNLRQGRPLFAIERMGEASNLERFWEMFGDTREQTLPDGTVEQEQYLKINSDSVLTLGGDAVASFKQPGPFIGETAKLLELFFYLYVQHSEVPEWALGNAIASSMASANTQVEPLVKFIEMKRSLAESDWIRQLIAVVQEYISAVEPGISSQEEATVKWADLTRQDGTLTLSTIEAGADRGYIDAETWLQQAPIEVDDIPGTLAKAQQEKEERDAANQEAAMDRALQSADQNAAAQDAKAQGEPPDRGQDQKQGGATQRMPLKKTA